MITIPIEDKIIKSQRISASIPEKGKTRSNLFQTYTNHSGKSPSYDLHSILILLLLLILHLRDLLIGPRFGCRNAILCMLATAKGQEYIYFPIQYVTVFFY